MSKAMNKVIYGDTVLIDLTADSVTADKILATYTAHDSAGNIITGTCTFDVNSQDATVQVAEMLAGKTAYARGIKLVGTMPDNGSQAITISTVNDAVTIAQGYHDGGGKAQILSTEKAKIIAANIRDGISILGVTGNLKPSSSVTAHAKTVTPAVAEQTVLPGTGYDYLSQVNVNAIPYVETENSAGGITVTIAGLR